MSTRLLFGAGALLLSGIFIHSANSLAIPDILKLNSAQKESLQKLRSSIVKDLPHEYMKDDGYLLRWLAVKNFNLDEAKSGLLQHVAWRKAENVDSILDEVFSKFEERYPYDLNSVSKNGLPILALEFGKTNLKKEVSSPEGYKLLARYRIKVLEEAEKKARELREKNNRKEDAPQFDVIDNLEGYSAESHECPACKQFAEEGMNLKKEQYPGAISNIFFVNTPAAFEKTFEKVIQKIPEKCRKSFHILHGRESYEPVINQFVDKDQFPKFL